ncbi:MurR/RpiR family transcriptional regulator [Vaginisenegalia massiliensis]|uniref:MurR/RpiR family transcriptional regulator n=1 Tax=Vaginisenegalia massiliensis TaxID=2058294 RepID=UPI0013DE7687|nr:MurR/RpiR family transcriptional regulator [Vaginisenegalia massiliensis]
MACISKINNIYPHLTSTECKIADYIKANLSQVLASSTQSLAKETQTSPSTWVRFAQKLGYSGIAALKVDLSKDEGMEVSDWTSVLSEEDSFDTMLNKSKQNLTHELEKTLAILNHAELKNAIDAMHKARRIYLFGIGGSAVPCFDLVHKLVRIDLDAIFHHESQLMLSQIAHITSEDVLILVSYSGRTKMVCDAAKGAKQAGAKIIAITQYNTTTPLAKIADIPIYIPIEERPLRIGAIASRNSSLVVTDFLYLGLARLDFNRTKKNLIKTRNFVQEVSE